jgi:hypothetical protein
MWRAFSAIVLDSVMPRVAASVSFRFFCGTPKLGALFSLHFRVAVLVHRGPLFPNLDNVFRSMSNLIFPVYKASLAKFEHAAGRTRPCYNSQNHATEENPAVSICIVFKITRISILNTYRTPSKFSCTALRHVGDLST